MMEDDTKRTIDIDGVSGGDRSAFRLAEKRYRAPPPLKKQDMKLKANLRDKELLTSVLFHPLYTGPPPVSTPENENVFPIGSNGFYVMKGALSNDEQRIWAQRALETYASCAHTNLTNLGEEALPPFKEIASTMQGNAAALKKFDRLRWASLGYRYDWTKRRYSEDNIEALPQELVSFGNTFSARCKQTIAAEAAIVNFYLATTCRSVMGGHRDDAEPCQSHPIVSMSIGCSCIFLLGGETKDIEPRPLYLKSGDVVVMSGPSRSFYHGVARVFTAAWERSNGIVPAPSSSNFCAVQEKDPSMAAVVAYLENHRININVRQVRKD